MSVYVFRRISIRRADEDVLDLARSRRAEQEVLNAIDEA